MPALLEEFVKHLPVWESYFLEELMLQVCSLAIQYSFSDMQLIETLFNLLVSAGEYGNIGTRRAAHIKRWMVENRHN